MGLISGTPPLRGESLIATYCVYCGRTKSSEWTADAGRAPSDDHRRGTADCGILRAAADLNDWQPNRLVRENRTRRSCDAALA